MSKMVFLSVGRTSTIEQESYVHKLEEFLQAEGLTPQALGRSYFLSRQPLKAIDDLMKQCHGTVIVAFERVCIKSGVDKRGSKDQKSLIGVKLPTVWNQIEATMAYTLGIPLLVIVEDTLRNEGLLESGYDWYVLRVKLTKESFSEREFQGVFADWKHRVNSFQIQQPKPQPVPIPTPEPIPTQVPSLKPQQKIKILFLTANPGDTSRLRLDQESRAIDEVLRKADYRDKIEFNQYQAIRVSDLQDVLLRFKPQIVHFSGHGSDTGQILLEDNQGNSVPVSDQSLGKLFALLKENIRCIVLNACFSEQQAKAIAENIDCVIGMSAEISDPWAIAFATSFYRGIAYGKDVMTAFELGRVQLDLENMNAQHIPKLIALHTDPKTVTF